MGTKLNVILCATSHLPSGISEAKFETLYKREIKPLISALDKFPKINVVFHYSGVILHWIERRHPELFMLLEDLINRKQAELLGGGFYNPIFPLLPLPDKIGQIEMLTTYLRKHFGKRPQGCWLPALAWEQNLVGPLNSCGMNYTFLEDEQFFKSGFKAGDGGIFSPCLTEDQGKLITVFPIARKMGRELKKDNGRTFLNLVSELFPHDGNDGILVIPIEETNYDELFQNLSDSNSRIKFTCPSKLYKTLRFLKKNYFPGVWMSERGPEPSPRQFLANYSEVDGLYAKMIYIHTLINNQLRGDKTRKRTAFNELWKAQDSGVFQLDSESSPGFFHSPVRKAAYSSLLEAEKITREKQKFTPSLSVFDFDLDGIGEYIFQDDKLNCFIKLKGASIFELDYMAATWNYLDTLGFDRSKNEKRNAFADWLAPADLAPEEAGPEGLKGGRFCGNEEFEVVEEDRVRRCAVFRLPSKPDLLFGEIEIVKTWQLKKNSLALEYILKNTGKKSLSFLFSPSVDLSFPGGAEEFLKLFSVKEGEKELIPLKDPYTVKNAKTIEFQDIKNESLINLDSNRCFDARVFHIYSSFSGQEEYQSTCMMPLFSVSLEEGKTWKVAFSLKISS